MSLLNYFKRKTENSQDAPNAKQLKLDYAVPSTSISNKSCDLSETSNKVTSLLHVDIGEVCEKVYSLSNNAKYNLIKNSYVPDRRFAFPKSG
jgi:hypothetical protein